MRRHFPLSSTAGLALLAAAVLLAGGSVVAAAGRYDPASVVGPKACRDCHTAEYEAWERTAHAKSKDEEGSGRAKAIRAALGVQAPLDESPLCASCHVTEQEEKGGKLKAVAGVSCESCHGAAREWLDAHADYGKGATRATETSDHRTDRLGASMAGGMLRPQNLYSVAANCYQCHTVPQEQLVNRGGHPAGSAIELVSWSQGAVRHNFMQSGGARNRETSPERKRLLYVLGRMLELEFGLRGLAGATAGGRYAEALSERVAQAIADLEAIRAAAGIVEIDAMLAAARVVKLAPGQAAALGAAADTVSTAAQDFAEQPDRHSLLAVDAMIPGPSAYRGPVYKP